MRADQLTQGVVDRLRERMPSFKVDHFPDAPNRYPMLSAQKELLVSYDGSGYDAVQSAVPASAPRTLRIKVDVLVRSLRRADGAQLVVESIIGALFGWEPAVLEVHPTNPSAKVWRRLGGSCLRPTSDDFVSETQGLWRWEVVFETETVKVAKAPPLPPTTPFNPTEILP